MVSKWALQNARNVISGSRDFENDMELHIWDACSAPHISACLHCLDNSVSIYITQKSSINDLLHRSFNAVKMF